MKGTLSEAELMTLRTRLFEGRWNKARRGELGRSIPVGYQRDPTGRWIIDPNRQVHDRLTYVFTLFRRLHVARQVLIALKTEQLKLPVRCWGGPRHGQLTWLRQRPAPEPIVAAAPKPASKPAARPAQSAASGKLSFHERRELERLPARIEELEQRQQDGHARTADPAFYQQEPATVARQLAELRALDAELEAAYARWEALAGRK